MIAHSMFSYRRYISTNKRVHNLDLSMVVAVTRLKRPVESIEGKINALQGWQIYAL
ncbi:unnamed protein product [Brassica oleracea var. botrytis]